MNITLLTPQQKTDTLEHLLSTLRKSNRRLLPPFSTEACDFIGELSKTLFADPRAKKRADLQALAFFLRPAEIKRLHEQFASLQTPQTQLTARGLAFHIPPANVDPMFVYSWVFSLLIGNRNIVRLSTKRGESTEILLHLLSKLLKTSRFKTIAELNWFVSYGHEETITAGISSLCDIRIIWGGDTTIQSIRHIPLPPRAKELTFADRFSFSVLNADEYLRATDETQEQLAKGFFNDAYWFDQMGCSSPRLVVWIGKQMQQASEAFFAKVNQQITAKGYQLPVGALLNKLTFAQEAAITRPISAVRQYGNALHVVRLDTLNHFSREHCGAGLFFEYGAKKLGDIADFIVDKDQTVTYFGVDVKSLHADRAVPIGSALNFNRYWDGYDLLLELAKVGYFA